jgi:epoxide hydrolase-like protein
VFRKRNWRTCAGASTRHSDPSGKRSRTSQGVQLATIQQLARYRATGYDWRKCEATLKAHPQFLTEIDGLDIHFIHARSKHANPLPLIVTHGWPGPIIEQLKILLSGLAPASLAGEERVIYMAAIEPNGATTVDKEPFPTADLPQGAALRP